MIQRKDGIETRHRILDAARIVFSRKGYHEARISDICELAECNTAAVNYHFGDKETLYIETWREAFQRSIEKHPPDGGVHPDAPPEERLRGRIRSIIERLSDSESREFDIVHKEIANPTGLLNEVMQQTIEPIRKGMTIVINEMLGENATQRDVQLCEMSINAQCLNPLMHRRRHPIVDADRLMPLPQQFDFDDEAIAEHIFRFSLAGLREMRALIEKRIHAE